jgi:hypothetical protein
MNQDTGAEGDKSRTAMQGLTKEILDFNEQRKEPTTVLSYTGEHKYHVQKIITAEDDEQFLRRAKNTRWIESSLEAALPNVSLDEGISCLLDYLLTKHGDVTREKLRDLGVLPKK